MNAFARWADYKHFAYERTLARMELEALGATQVHEGPEGFSFVHRDPQAIADRATYFGEVVADGVVFATRQRQAELQHLEARGGSRRQATRFGVHGFHEYKGKFNPQLARALINVVDSAAEVFVDPFAGSGTAVLEAQRLGLAAAGRDRSPIAVFMADAKAQALTFGDHKALAKKLATFSGLVADALKRGQDTEDVSAVSWLPASSLTYLEQWFTAPAFGGLTAALSLHRGANRPLHERLSLLAISGILRVSSLQEPQDLRVRRRRDPFVAPSLRDLYLDRIDRFLIGLSELEPLAVGRARVTVGSADDPDLFKNLGGGRRLIVTSPPYATALPYIDTDRLSLLALGLSTPEQLRSLERALTGSREWNTSESSRWWSALNSNEAALPVGVMRTLEAISDANAASGAGFRRNAVPPLLYRYFTQMRSCFVSWHQQLRDGETAVLVVGRNRTGPKGAEIPIDTPTLLGMIATTVGFDVADQIELETWPRFGLHAANAVNGEDALVLRRSSS